MTEVERQHELVKKSLIEFVSEHIPGADFTVVDEIVLSYIISVLEGASDDPCFDVDGFIEMMSAYFNEFSQIEPATICTWIFRLENELSVLEKTGVDNSSDFSMNSLSLSDIIPESKLRARQTSISEKENNEVVNNQNHVKRVKHLSEASDCGSTDSSGCEIYTEEFDVLHEMFPESSFLEVKHCITIAKGDIDTATQILLHRQETGQSLTSTSSSLQNAKCAATINDAELKNRIIERYSYVDKNAGNREYKPVIPKVEPKKLVRYRDNKIVSLKGERFTEVHRDDDGELKKPKNKICP